MPFISLTSSRNPVLPSLFTSGNPPELEEITATLQAIASKATNPKLSVSEGSKNKSDTESTFSTAFSFPIKRILSHKFKFLFCLVERTQTGDIPWESGHRNNLFVESLSNNNKNFT